jgi:hypothetical protein
MAKGYGQHEPEIVIARFYFGYEDVLVCARHTKR